MRRAPWASRTARVILATVGFVLLGATAWAYWSSTGDTAASVTTASLEAPTDVTAVVRGTTVDVGWAPPSSGLAADGYYVTRHTDGTTSPACGTSPTSLTAASATTCSDVAVPDGTHSYSVTAVLATWTASSVPSDEVTVVSASAMAFTTQPGDGTSESTLDTQPVVAVLDSSGDPVPWDNSTVVTVELTTPDGAVLSCDSTTVTASSGSAAFTGCEVDKAGTYTLTATSPGLIERISASFTVTAGPATRVAFTRQPSDGTGGVSLASQPQVAVQDAWGNTVTTDTSTVTLALTAPDGATLTCSGGTSKTTTAGSATFSNCKVDRPGDYTLTATDGLLTSSVSDSFTITVGPASRLVYTTQPSATATSEVDLATQPKLVLQDAGGNIVTEDSATEVTLALTTPNGALLSCDDNTVTASAAIVEFTGCQIDKAATYTLRATAGVIFATSSSVVVSAGPATRLAFTTQPSNSTGGVVLTTQPVVKVLDSYGNTVPAPVSSVTLALTPANGAALTCAANPRNTSSGVATFSSCKVDRPGDYTLTATTGSLTSAVSDSFTITVGPASKLVYTTQPSATATSEVDLAMQPELVLQDAGGNIVTEDSATVVTLALSTPNGAVLSCDSTTVTASSGVVEFTGCQIDKAATYTLRATAGVIFATSSSVVVSAGPATRLAFTTQPSNGTGGVVLTTQPVVKVLDSYGNPILTPASSVTLALTPANGAALTCTANPRTTSSGVATFAACKVDRPGTYTLTATNGSLTSAVSSSFTITVGPATKLVYTTQPSTTATSEVDLATQPVVTVQDAGGNTVTADSTTVVTLALTTPNGGILSCDTNPVTASSGVVAFTGCQIDKSGTYTLKATTTTGLTLATSGSVVVSAGPATRLAFTTQPSNGTGGVVLTTQPIVKVLDSYGNTVLAPVSSVTLALTTPGGAALTCTTNPRSTVSGAATFVGCKVDRPGTYTLTATSGSLTSAVSSSFTITVGPATKLVYTTQPSTTATSEMDLATQPVVTVQDAGGNTVTADSTTVVTLALTTAGGGTLSCDTNPVTASSGVAAFTGCQIDKAATYTLKATTTTGLTLATSGNVVVSAGPKTRLAFTTQPSSGTGGVALTTQPIVKVLDSYGNTVLTPTSSVTLALTTPGGAALTCTTNPLTTSAGAAGYTACKVDRPGTYTLTATSGSLTSAVSTSFTITVGPATKLGYTTQPSTTATSEVDLPTQPVVTVQDAGGNTVTADSTTVVTLALTTPNGGILSCDTNPVTASSGVVAFTGCQIDKSGPYTLKATTTTGPTLATSGSVVVSAGPRTRLAFTTQPSNGTGGVAPATQPVVRIQDAYGNTVTTDTSTVTIALTTPNGAVLTCTTSNFRAAAAGTATFAGCKVDKAGTYTLTATSGSLTSAVSTSITITVGPPTKLAYTTQPSSTAMSSVPLATQPVVVVQDAGGNTVTTDSRTVTLALTTPGTATIACDTTTVAASSGVAAFAGCRVDKIGTYTLKATAAGLTLATSGNVTITVGPAAQLGFSIQPSATGTSQVPLPTQPAVRVQDSGGNTVTTDTSTVTIALTTPDGATLACTTSNSRAASAGTATFTGCKIDKVGTYTLTATDGSLTPAVSTIITIDPAAASKLAFTSQPDGGPAATPFTSQPTVTVQDASGNTATGSSSSITLALTNPNGAVLTCTTNPLAASVGVAAFGGCQVDLAGTYTLTATGPALTSTVSTSFTVF